MRYVLDTTFLIDYLRDDPIAVARYAQFFAEGDEVLVNEIVVCETRAGLPDTGVLAFEELLEPTECVQPGPSSAMKAGQWRVEARRRGYVLSLADALIAAAAEASDATVLTRNVRDFSLTPVRVESY
jgi:predicted nucleic acid-binding protein